MKRPEYGDEEEVAEWKQKVEYARLSADKGHQCQVGVDRSFGTAQSDERVPGQMRTSHTTVARQVNIEEAVASAEAQFQKSEWNEDLLLMATTHYMQKRKETPKIIAYL